MHYSTSENAMMSASSIMGSHTDLMEESAVEAASHGLRRGDSGSGWAFADQAMAKPRSSRSGGGCTTRKSARAKGPTDSAPPNGPPRVQPNAPTQVYDGMMTGSHDVKQEHHDSFGSEGVVISGNDDEDFAELEDDDACLDDFDDDGGGGGNDSASGGKARKRRVGGAASGGGEGGAPEDNKAKANRDRNREHARNTRLRKKAYVETLKRTVHELSAQYESAERHRRVQASMVAERGSVRKRVLQTFFFYRASGELGHEKWAKLLDESCMFALPITPYRSFSASEVVNNQRVVIGIDGMIVDTASLAVLLQSIGRAGARGERKITARYFSGPEVRAARTPPSSERGARERHVRRTTMLRRAVSNRLWGVGWLSRSCSLRGRRQDMLLDGDNLMCRWLMRTDNAIECGAFAECYKRGMLKARFTEQNKIIALEVSHRVAAAAAVSRRPSPSLADPAVGHPRDA